MKKRGLVALACATFVRVGRTRSETATLCAETRKAELRARIATAEARLTREEARRICSG